jgi:hypothetical protein
MQDISMFTSRTPIVYHAEGTKTVYLTFEGLRESRTVTDKRLRIRISMPAAAAIDLWQQLADDVPAEHARVVYEE